MSGKNIFLMAYIYFAHPRTEANVGNWILGEGHPIGFVSALQHAWMACVGWTIMNFGVCLTITTAAIFISNLREIRLQILLKPSTSL